VSGHSENGHLLTPEGFALHLPPEIERTMLLLPSRKR
jgi:hypothetical protein